MLHVRLTSSSDQNPGYDLSHAANKRDDEKHEAEKLFRQDVDKNLYIKRTNTSIVSICICMFKGPYTYVDFSLTTYLLSQIRTKSG